jgi:hypothetical protein
MGSLTKSIQPITLEGLNAVTCPSLAANYTVNATCQQFDGANIPIELLVQLG